MSNIKEDISLKQAFSMLFIFLSGSIMAISGNGDAGRDSYISAIISILIVLLLFYIYYKPFLIYKEDNFFLIIQRVYGKHIGFFVNLITAISVFLVGIVSFARFTLFLKTVALDQTPLFVIGIFMAITCMYSVFCGFEVIARFCEICLIFVIAFILFFTAVSYPIFDFKNIFPILEDGFLPVYSGVYSIVASPFMESFALVTLIFQSRKRNDMPKSINLAIISSCTTICIVFLRNLFILGYPAIESLYYPSYLAVSLVSFGDFFQRQEVFVSIIFLLADIIKISVLSVYLCKYINFTLKTFEYKNYAIAVVMLIFSFSNFLFASTMDLFSFLGVYRHFLLLPFGILPLITFILCNYKFLLKDLFFRGE